GDPQVQGSDRPAVRGESDAPAGRREAGLRGDCSGHHRGRHQGGGDRWQKSRGARGQVQRSRHQGDPQVHRHQTCDICREVRRGHDQHRRLRVWGGLRGLGAPAEGGEVAASARDRLRGLCQRPAAGGGVGDGRCGNEHGHPLDRHQGVRGPGQREAGAGEGPGEMRA
ncbi:unnamed protein product, partial [Prorocentrum cordatum]